MKLSLCNEVLRDLEFARQCAFAAELGYAGLEVAPFTLGEDAFCISAAARAQVRRAAQDAGVAISGLHWLLVAPAGLSITSADSTVAARTLDVMRRLVELCAELGGEYLVHGSPAQRRISGEADAQAAAGRAEAAWAAAGAEAARAGVVYCIEPLARPEADFVNTLAEAAAIVRRIDLPALRTMIDTSAAARMEAEPVAELIRRWMPGGLVAHVQLNDSNRRGPGEGADRFAPVIGALNETQYAGWVAIEPFQYRPDGPTCAARSIGYVSGLIEAVT
jgi:D-psicose/D-tagatose/L-ribulose 3-epimerase